MSDFPDIGDFTPTGHSTTDGESDFLARERAALGDDADFLTAQETSLPDSGSGGEFSAFSGSAAQQDEDVAMFESEFPDVDDAAPSSVSVYTGSMADNAGAGSGGNEGFGSAPAESPFITEWREKQAVVIADREARAAEAKAHTQEAARKALDRFYEDYNAKKAKNIERNRERQEQESYEYDSGNLWERVCYQAGIGEKGESKSADSSTKGTKNVRDTSRMRQLLLDLRKDPRAPGLVKAE